ncbi:MAG TPA: lamin tail domain-containing protein [Tepidisphaeraceae bacterium]|jgi:hypothetical protein
MQNLIVSKIKPNPSGKDRTRFGGATAAQLGAEWVDIRNNGYISLSLDGIHLYHRAYRSNGFQFDWHLVCPLGGSLGPGQVLRVHSGEVRSLGVLHPNDQAGADRHLFTGRDVYVWNNAQADEPMLWNPVGQVRVDSAEYDPYPPEGAVLVRSGAKLIRAAA